MIALYLIAAHMVGDFVLQTRWQAAGKFTDYNLRARHVAAYCVPFWPIAAVYGRNPWWHGLAFIVLLELLHFATDSRRFTSTLGETLVFWLTPGARMTHLNVADPEVFVDGERVHLPRVERTGTVVSERMGRMKVRMDLPPNPWTPIPILIDQTLHVCQLALLGGLFLT